MSTRQGGVSVAPWDSLNLGVAVGDDPAAVARNRRRYTDALEGARPVWLRQVHGVHVRRLTAGDLAPGAADDPADAAWTDQPGIACTVQVADCLPLLVARRDGSAVAAAHAGWRGLAAGVVEATVAAVCDGGTAQPADLLAWMGPCIGPRRFEVGADVLAAFGQDPAGPDPARFVVAPRPDGQPRWLANLQRLAADRLAAAGVVQVIMDDACTVEDSARFFSFRRDGVTGRMAAAVWLR
jgi:YfiH family protein